MRDVRGPCHAEELVSCLEQLGWPVAYTANMEGLVWQFPTEEVYAEFEEAFDRTVEEMAGDPFFWEINIDADAVINGAYRLQIGGHKTLTEADMLIVGDMFGRGDV